MLQELNLYLQFLFELIVDRGPSVGLDVALNRFDLFHGHLFLALDSGRLGILYVQLLIVMILILCSRVCPLLPCLFLVPKGIYFLCYRFDIIHVLRMFKFVKVKNATISHLADSMRRNTQHMINKCSHTIWVFVREVHIITASINGCV